jgi:multiple sugar transport system permease protein
MKTANNTLRKNVKSTIVFIVCILLAIICLLPIYILIINATRDSISIQRGVSIIPSVHFFQNYKNLMAKRVFQPFIGFRNSFIIATSATVLSVFFSTLTAYGLIVYDFKFKGFAYSFILAVLMIPAQVSGVGFLSMMTKINLYDTFVPLIVPAIAAPATVFFMRQYMKSAFPLEIVEAARIDGSNEFRTFMTIGIPMVKPGIAVQCIFAFIFQWNNFFTPSMLIVSESKKTLPMMVRNLSSDRLATDYGIVYAGIALTIVPLVIVYIFLSKYIIAGVALGGVKE